MNNTFIKIGAILGAVGVSLGAFGAHALKASLEASGRTDTFETAVKYLFCHALGIILIGIIQEKYPNKWLKYAGTGMTAGVIIFSGSLFTICFTGIKAFGAVAPIGGTLMILSWLSVFWGVGKK
ncbi:MAG: DUF423 domain-containing protein [Bacteroidetes bacterium]|nr:DUF423 domain-containing protein [Bacteroidota bacterium]